MKKYAKFGLLIVAISMMSFAGGFFVGVREGLKQFFLLESSVKASLLTYELQSLRAGNAEKFMNTKEIELDGQLILFSKFRHEGHPWIFLFEGEDWQGRDHAKYMKRVAAYRKQYPPVIPTIDSGENNPIREEMERYKQDVKNITAEILEEYGK